MVGHDVPDGIYTGDNGGRRDDPGSFIGEGETEDIQTYQRRTGGKQTLAASQHI